MPDLQHVLNDIQSVKSLMIRTATGQAKIDNVEEEYVQLRGRLRANLVSRKVVDPNKFGSLWDWYNYYKSSGITSYQSRRQFVNDLYAPTISAVEALGSLEHRDVPGAQESAIFSERYGYRPQVARTETVIREDAPRELRRVVIDTAVRTGWDYDDLLLVAARIGKRAWEPAEACESRVSSHVQLARLVSSWDWYLVYDFIEAVCAATGQLHSVDEFSSILNEYFRAAGIGWQLVEGKMLTRGTDAFETALHKAAESLEQSTLPTSANEIQKALTCLSRRPTADLTGAIQHAVAALECTARFVSGDARATLGDILRRNPGLIPKPLDSAVEKAWGYASEMGRHLQEGREPQREDAELIVGIAALVATYLSKKKPQP